MNNYSNILFPEIINEAFPILDDASYIRQLASLVPLCSTLTKPSAWELSKQVDRHDDWIERATLEIGVAYTVKG